jgi:hypothetical protein
MAKLSLNLLYLKLTGEFLAKKETQHIKQRYKQKAKWPTENFLNAKKIHQKIILA